MNCSQSNPMVQAFVASAKEAIEKMAMFSLEVDSIERATEVGAPGKLVAAMELASETSPGVASISLERGLGRTLVAGMVGVGLDEADELLLDGIGELLNMIVGGAKSRLRGTPNLFRLTLPQTAANGRSPILPGDGIPGADLRCIVGTEEFVLTIWSKGVNGGL